MAGNDTVRLFTQLARIRPAQQPDRGRRLGHGDRAETWRAIGKAAEGFVTGVGYSAEIDTPENKKFVADFRPPTRPIPTSMAPTPMA